MKAKENDSDRKRTIWKEERRSYQKKSKGKEEREIMKKTHTKIDENENDSGKLRTKTKRRDK